MPAIAHVGVGFAAKRIAPGINVIYLILAAELIEIIFFVFVIAGAENMPLPDKPPFSPYSHGLFMGIMWSVIAAALSFLISRNRKTSFIIGALVLSRPMFRNGRSSVRLLMNSDTSQPLNFVPTRRFASLTETGSNRLFAPA